MVAIDYRTAPSTPSGLVATRGVQAISLDWTPNPEPLQYYEIYRHTSDTFGVSSRIGITDATRFVDVSVNPGSEYFYWLRASDVSSFISPIHPGSTAGVSAVSSQIATTDITSEAISSNAEFISLAGITLNGNSTDLDSGTLIGNTNLTTQGGFVLLNAQCNITDFPTSLQDLGLVGLFRAGAGLINRNGMLTITSNSGSELNLSITKVDAPPTGVNCYYLKAISIPGSATAQYRQLSATELKR